jgi:hypothetical protein
MKEIEKFKEEIEILKNSKESNDHIKLGNYYMCGCFIPINYKKAYEEYKLSNELDNSKGFGEIAKYHLFETNNFIKNEKKGIESLEKGITQNDFFCKLVLADYLFIIKEKYHESIKIFEELLENKYYPGFTQYGEYLINGIPNSEDPSHDKLRGKKLIIEAAKDGEDKNAIIYLLKEKKFRKEYEKYLNIEFLEGDYFSLKYDDEIDINEKIKFLKEGVNYNSHWCISMLTSIYSKWGDLPDPKREEKYHKIGKELNSWGSFYFYIEKCFEMNDFDGIEKLINEFNEISSTLNENFDLNYYLYEKNIVTDEQIKKSSKYFKNLILELELNLDLLGKEKKI